MKKIGVYAGVFLVLTLFTASLAAAQDDSAKIDKAYGCVLDKVKGKCADLTLDEQAFSLLALSYQSDVKDECKKALLEKSEDNKCWPKGGCKIRDTALAVLALQHIGGDSSQAVQWILGKNGTPKDLTWYLQIDAREETACKISYGGKDFTTKINADKTFSQSAGSCLTKAQNNYWLQISLGCLQQTFTVSCDKAFISNLIYRKTNSQVFYVSSDTKSAPESGSTENQVVSTCFGNPCEYEGSLWATLALSKAGKDVAAFLPYLNALATDNEKLFPSAFLHILTGDEDYFSTITGLQGAGFWDLKSTQGKYYDTALALLSLQNANAEQADAAKQWLLETQPGTGCWGNVRDTEFLLYSAWPKTPTKGGGEVTYCKDFNYFCISPGECAEAGGDQLGNYFCPSLSATCCTKPSVEKTCKEKGGFDCKEEEECTGSSLDASDTKRCCDTACVQKPTKPECEVQGYLCESSCGDNQEEAFYGCTAGSVCCKTKEVPPLKKSYWWIWVLLILIVLVILGIIFKNRIQLFLFKKKSKGGPSGSSSGFGAGPRFPPTSPLPPRPLSGRNQARIPGKLRPSEETDKELEETLKKLKEMSG